MEHYCRYGWPFQLLHGFLSPTNRYYSMMKPFDIDLYELKRQHIVHATNGCPERVPIHYNPVAMYVWNDEQQITTAKMQGCYSHFGMMSQLYILSTIYFVNYINYIRVVDGTSNKHLTVQVCSSTDDCVTYLT